MLSHLLETVEKLFLLEVLKERQEYGEYKNCGDFANHLGEGSKKEELRGGWRKFNDKKFNIQLCAKHVYEQGYGITFGGNSRGSYKVRVAIFNEQGVLQSLGYFKSGAENLFHFYVNEDSIEYGDWDGNSRVIKMPPSRLEWIRARLPSIEDDLFDK